MKTLIRRAAADRDVEDILDYYLLHGGASVASRFVDTLEAAYHHLSRHPATGSPGHADELGLRGLRCWPLRSFPYLIFYFEHGDAVEVWRVLHGQRDVPTHLLGLEEDGADE